jgi:hypothetical protein
MVVCEKESTGRERKREEEGGERGGYMIIHTYLKILHHLKRRAE